MRDKWGGFLLWIIIDQHKIYVSILRYLAWLHRNTGAVSPCQRSKFFVNNQVSISERELKSRFSVRKVCLDKNRIAIVYEG